MADSTFQQQQISNLREEIKTPCSSHSQSFCTTFNSPSQLRRAKLQAEKNDIWNTIVELKMIEEEEVLESPLFSFL